MDNMCEFVWGLRNGVGVGMVGQKLNKASDGR